MMKCGLIFSIILELLSITYAGSSDHIKLKHGLIILSGKSKEWYICYNRFKVVDKDIQWQSELDIRTGECKNSLGTARDCIQMAIENCGWEISTPNEIAVSFIYTLEYRNRMDKMSYNVILKDNEREVIPVAGYNLGLYKQVSTDEKTNALFEWLKFHYNTNTSLKESSFIYLSLSGLSIGINNDKPSPTYEWMSTEFTLHNEKHVALLNTFYCLSPYRIMQTALHILYNQHVASNKPADDKILHPCYPDKHRLPVDHDSYKNICHAKFYNSALNTEQFVGDYDFDSCNKLINSIINYENLCDTNVHCNFSSLSEEKLGKNIKQIKLYTEDFSFEKEKKSKLVKTLYQKNGEYCIKHSAKPLPADQHWRNVKCFTFNVLYAILNHNKFLDDNTLVSIINTSPWSADHPLWIYVFIDDYYGSILPEEGILTAFDKPSTTEETLTIIGVEFTTAEVGDVSTSSAAPIIQHKLSILIQKQIALKVILGMIGALVLISFIIVGLVYFKNFVWDKWRSIRDI